MKSATAVLPKPDATAAWPGVRSTSDGAGAVAYVECAVSESACAYPITSSQTMGALYQAEVANGRTNLWGTPLSFLELESEHSAASACEGIADAGGRVVNFTSGQGLILMKEVLYVIAGKRLPAIFHIGARALTSHSLNVHCGHDDVMGVADCGWGTVFAANVQDVADLALIARRAAEESETPFLVVQDGFLTTHTIETCLLPEPELMKEFVGDPRDRLHTLMDPTNPIMSGVVQNQDSYMKGKVAQRAWYDKVPGALRRAMSDLARLTGREHGLLREHRMEDAEVAIVAMGTAFETACATVDYLRRVSGTRAGAVHVTSFRPFPGPELVECLGRAKAVIVIERLDVPLMQSNPLAAELKAAFADAASRAPGYPRIASIPRFHCGIGGLGSRDITPHDMIAAIEAAMSNDGPRLFVMGVDHPLALPAGESPDVRPSGAFSMRGHSIGGFGSITTNKVIATLSADVLDLCVQAFPKYGSEKKGLPTSYYLTIAPEAVKTHCELDHVEFVAVNSLSAFHTSDPLAGLQPGGLLFLQSTETDPAKVWASLPPEAQRVIRARKIRVHYLDTMEIARKIATNPDLQIRMQGIVLLGVFLRVTPFRRARGLRARQIFQGVEKALRKYFGRRGEQVIKENVLAAWKGFREVRDVPRSIVHEQ